MNRKGTLMYMVLIAIFYFITGMILYQFLKPDITLARTEIVCSSPDTWGDMFNCLLLDGTIPLVIIAIISTTGGIITDKAR
jgi:hypothetical protein